MTSLPIGRSPLALTLIVALYCLQTISRLVCIWSVKVLILRSALAGDPSVHGARGVRPRLQPPCRHVVHGHARLPGHR